MIWHTLFLTGNDDKAWNDPPVFAYTELQGTPAAAPKRTPLNKRVPYPQGGLPVSATTASGLASTGLPPLPTEAPLSRVAPTPAIDATEDSSASPFSSDALRKDTLENLERVMSHCLENMEKRKKDDVKKRLDLLWSAWEQGKLSTVVQQKTQELTSELQKGNYERANALHVSLMVDYVSEVSQWMVGIKHLISAAQQKSTLSEDDPQCDSEAVPSS